MRVCVYATAVYARYVAISIVQHVPREWKTNVFKSALFALADVYARKQFALDNKPRVCAQIIHADLEEKR